MRSRAGQGSLCSQLFLGPKYLLKFTENESEIPAWGRSSKAREVVAAVAFWLERPEIAFLRERYLFVDRRERRLSAFGDKALDSVAELGPETCRLEKGYCDRVELRIFKGDRSCLVQDCGSKPHLLARFCWDETEQFSLAVADDTSLARLARRWLIGRGAAVSDVTDFARLLRRWLIDRAAATALAREDRNLKVCEVAEYYESGRPIEGEFILSWKEVRNFYDENWLSIAPAALALLDRLKMLGYDRQLRAGQSMSTLILSRSRRHGLQQQKFAAVEFDESGFLIKLDRPRSAFVSVASSSAVPGLFAPLTLESHREGCVRLAEAAPRLAVGKDDSARTRLTKSESLALAHGDRPFLHLVDGGVSDNLGIRRITDYVARTGGIGAVLEMFGAGHPALRRIVLISVNSERRTGLAIDRSGKIPSIFRGGRHDVQRTRPPVDRVVVGLPRRGRRMAP